MTPASGRASVGVRAAPAGPVPPGGGLRGHSLCRRGSPLVPKGRGLAARRRGPSTKRPRSFGGGGTSDWATFYDEEDGGGEEPRSTNEEWENEFAFRASSFTQGVIQRANGLISSLSRTIIREFSLTDVSEQTVSLLLRGCLVIAGLSLLRLVLGLFLGVAVLGFAALFLYRVLYKYVYDSGREEGEEGEEWEGGGPFNGGRPRGKASTSNDDVIDVRIYPQQP